MDITKEALETLAGLLGKVSAVETMIRKNPGEIAAIRALAGDDLTDAAIAACTDAKLAKGLKKAITVEVDPDGALAKDLLHHAHVAMVLAYAANNEAKIDRALAKRATTAAINAENWAAADLKKAASAEAKKAHESAKNAVKQAKEAELETMQNGYTSPFTTTKESPDRFNEAEYLLHMFFVGARHAPGTKLAGSRKGGYTIKVFSARPITRKGADGKAKKVGLSLSTRIDSNQPSRRDVQK